MPFRYGALSVIVYVSVNASTYSKYMLKRREPALAAEELKTSLAEVRRHLCPGPKKF